MALDIYMQMLSTYKCISISIYKKNISQIKKCDVKFDKVLSFFGIYKIIPP